MGADRVIAVSLRSRWSEKDGPKHIFDVIGQCFSIAQDMSCQQSKSCADLVIEPDVTGYRYDDFERSADLVALGEQAVKPFVHEIRSWMPPALAEIARPARTTAPIIAPALNAATPK